MKILYLGSQHGTSNHRAKALERLGHLVRHINPDDQVPSGKLRRKLHYETGGVLCEDGVARGVLSQIGEERFDAAWVDAGRYVGPRLLSELRRLSGVLVNFNQDDPYGSRDRGSWALFKRTIHYYDTLVVRRKPNVQEAEALGAKKALFSYLTADEVAHRQRDISREEQEQLATDVLFVGTWMPERGPFIKSLLEHGVPLALYGNRWDKAPEWPLLKKVWRGAGTTLDDDYAKLIQCAKICLGLVSRGNRDLHTQRSLEVPYLGSLLCAERTEEHRELYREGEEAFFWSSPQECAQICLSLLENDTQRRESAVRGHRRVVADRHLNEAFMSKILSETIGLC